MQIDLPGGVGGISRGGSGMRLPVLEPSVELRGDVERGIVEVVVAGPWTGRVRIDVAAAVRKALAEQPRALLLNLAAIEDADPAVLGALLLAEPRGPAAAPPVPVLQVPADAARPPL